MKKDILLDLNEIADKVADLAKEKVKSDDVSDEMKPLEDAIQISRLKRKVRRKNIKIARLKLKIAKLKEIVENLQYLYTSTERLFYHSLESEAIDNKYEDTEKKIIQQTAEKTSIPNIETLPVYKNAEIVDKCGKLLRRKTDKFDVEVFIEDQFEDGYYDENFNERISRSISRQDLIKLFKILDDDVEANSNTISMKNQAVMECYNNLISCGSNKYNIEITPISGYDDADEVSVDIMTDEEFLINLFRVIDDFVKVDGLIGEFKVIDNGYKVDDGGDNE